jgi:phage pi2 protein 07
MRTIHGVDIKTSFNPFMKNFRTKVNYENKIEFKKTSWSFIDDEKKSEPKRSVTWKTNVILHPSELNLEYDA